MLETFQILLGLVLLVIGGELLVRGAASLAAAMQISPLVIGLTVVAFGTSAPELGVSLQAALAGDASIAVGNVVGSNIINILFVLGAAAVVAPLIVSSDLIRKDLPVMIAATAVFWWMASDGNVSRWEGIAMFVTLLVYLWQSITGSRKATKAQAAEIEEYAETLLSAKDYFIQIGFLIAGLVMLGIGANQLVAGATSIAESLGVSQLVIGLTVVAIGTSLPEVVTSIVASYRGQRDIAVGNVVGSNLFNILCVLGLTAAVSPVGVEVPADAISFDFPVMMAVAFVCLPIFFTGFLIRRWEGALFLAFYALYTIVILVVAKQPELSQHYREFVIYGVVPLMLLALMLSFVLNRKPTAT
ncbi:Inner membrane protein YrbG [Rubripirellula amarantea]|uniref:Inner membrane protein YrbG n=1 Tax=Rubripirellula amarantea TaxID=2527999 RepID=A0A5C5WKQ7_9BACT|nr:calcium/sodium antiporter [Rubripirellula amarantea]TWT50553.1 Inner membrane protein YrbG [Rubripirellula amarantea]